ncbi:hypothetical protein [Mesorhizobium tamadayense]|uniref:hypothetical protein n=1 Tax=Mesorhizobium tamadayense TaxID=425306 RepID=UPI00197DA494|nr:hypothetical protein [Mesorhizobium tamadayense]
MADSDHTTPLSFVTRRRVLGATAIAIAGWDKNALASDAATVSMPSDPAVAIWREWQDAHNLTERLCRQQQSLERRLAGTVGFPCATIRLSGGEHVTLHSLQALHEVLGPGPADAAIRAKAEADFLARQARWDAVDKEIGYSATLRAEREAADRAEDMLEILVQTPATSLAGVAAKLDAVLREGEICEDGFEFPWPQIRSALDDLIRLGREPMPGQAFPNEMLQPKPRRERGRGSLRVWTQANGGAA